MKKLSLKKLKLEASDLLQRNQLKSVFGGYGGYHGSGNGLCTCKLSSTSSAETHTDDCEKCGDLCDANYPNHTSWICVGA